MTMAGAGYVRAVRSACHGTVLTHARAASPLRVLTPRVSRTTAWLVSATFGGGLVGGDHVRLSLDVEAGARVLLTTQASTKVYRSPRVTRQDLQARVARSALLVVLPDPVVGFAGSTFEQHQRFALDDEASLLAVDWVTSGRHATGERWAFDRYASRIDICRDRRAIFYDHLSLDPRDGDVAARMGRFNTYVVAVATGPMFATLAADIVAEVAARPAARDADPVVSAAPLDGASGVILRMAAVNVERATAALRSSFRPVAALVGDDPWARRW